MSIKGYLIAGVFVLAGLWVWMHVKPLPPEEDWKLDVPSVAPVPVLSSPELQALVDRVAGADAVDAAVAWNKIGASYTSDTAYLADLGPALRDPRPVAFEMVKESLSNGGYTFIYFQIRTPSYSGKGVPAYCYTVGQSLCYFLWQYQDAGNNGHAGSTFKAWWSSYAPTKGLPAAR